MASLFTGVELQIKNGSKTLGEVALKDKTVGIYFSAHSPKSCRDFTELLKAFYDEYVKSNPFEVVFISSDGSANDLKKHMDELHGNWYFLPFGSKEKQQLTDKFEVESIPRMVFVAPNGDVICNDAKPIIL